MLQSPVRPIIVYSNPLSGHAHRVRLLISFLQVPHVVIDLQFEELKQAKYMSKSPFGQVPFIEDDSIVVYDSIAILAYLARRYDQSNQWLPDDPEKAADVHRWLSFSAGAITYGFNRTRLVKQFRFPLDYEQAKNIAVDLANVVEVELKTRDFAAGDKPTIADVAAYSYIALAEEGGISLNGYPSIRKWLARIEALPNFIPMHRGGPSTLKA